MFLLNRYCFYTTKVGTLVALVLTHSAHFVVYLVQLDLYFTFKIAVLINITTPIMHSLSVWLWGLIAYQKLEMKFLVQFNFEDRGLCLIED